MDSSYYRRITIAIIISSFSVILSACNMPGRATPTVGGIDLIATYAEQTAQAQRTDISKPPATFDISTPIATQPGTITPQTTPQPQDTVTPNITTSPGCNQAEFIKDITVPDDTTFLPGTPFVKTWQLKNTGTCDWRNDYEFFFSDGDQMGAPASVPLNRNVPPGEMIDISVNMIAPDTQSGYRGEWKLRSVLGEEFGESVWVKIIVATQSGMDLLSASSSASWSSGAGDQAITNLTFGGDINDTNGVATVVEGYTMENGRSSSKVLLTVPRHEKQGWISGLFPPYLIQQGNHFETRIAFLANQDGKCGSGNATFQVKYKEGDNIILLAEYQKTCDGRPILIDLDLSRLAGKTVQFILRVNANGSVQDDWAIWNSPQITK